MFFDEKSIDEARQYLRLDSEVDDPKSLKKLLVNELEKNNETIDDVIFSTYPLYVLNMIATLEEMQCWYLMGAMGDDNIIHPVDKQNMPFIAYTDNFVYFHDHNTTVEISKAGYVDGIWQSSKDEKGVISYKKEKIG